MLTTSKQMCPALPQIVCFLLWFDRGSASGALVLKRNKAPKEIFSLLPREKGVGVGPGRGTVSLSENPQAEGAGRQLRQSTALPPPLRLEHKKLHPNL